MSLANKIIILFIFHISKAHKNSRECQFTFTNFLIIAMFGSLRLRLEPNLCFSKAYLLESDVILTGKPEKRMNPL